MNLQIRTLEDNLLAVLNKSPVEMEVKRLILTNILDIIKRQADTIILQELQEEQTNAESPRCEQE